MKYWKPEDWFSLVVALVLIAVVIGGFFWLITDAQARDARFNQCVQSGYAGQLSLAGQNYCYKLSGDAGELVKIK